MPQTNREKAQADQPAQLRLQRPPRIHRRVGDWNLETPTFHRHPIDGFVVRFPQKGVWDRSGPNEYISHFFQTGSERSRPVEPEGLALPVDPSDPPPIKP